MEWDESVELGVFGRNRTKNIKKLLSDKNKNLN